MNEREIFKREVVKRKIEGKEEGMYANMGSIGDGFGSREIVKGEEMRVRTGTQGFVFEDKVR